MELPVTLDSSLDEYNGANVKVVPPDQLSEHDFTDDESGCSEILDYDQMREDQNFARAQWEAYQRQQEQERRAAGTNSEQGAGAPKFKEIDAVPSSLPNMVTQETSCDEKGEKTASANDVHSNIKYEPVENASDVKVTSNIAVSLGTVQGDGKIFDDLKDKSTSVPPYICPLKSSSDIIELDEKLESINIEGNNEDIVSHKEIPSASCQTRQKKKSVSEQIISSLCKVPQEEEKCPNIATQPSEKQEAHKGSKDKSKVEKKKVRKKQKKKANSKENKDELLETMNTEHSAGSVQIGSETNIPVPKISQCNYDTPNSNSVQTPETSSTSTPNTHSVHTPSTTSAHTPSTTSAHTPSMARTPGQPQRSEVFERTEPSVYQVMRMSNWEKYVQRTAKVVHILERRNPRMAAGTLKLFQDKNPNLAMFAPTDHRVPRMKIPMNQCPSDFYQNHLSYAKRIFLCRITQWREPRFALGELLRDLGGSGEVDSETEAMLLEQGVDHSEFPDAVLAHLPLLPWSIPPQELSCRTDLRKECIFTIDPSTARDLDDAMSCVQLPSGNRCVGVHIADVSYFVLPGTPLDQVAAARATSVYLVNKVIPMLPRVLCEQLCSLNPGEDRLAFSVIWELSPDGEVIGEWMGRTVIRSCAKLAYEHAQTIIDNPGKDHWGPKDLPNICAPHTSANITKVVRDLHAIALKLRQKRFRDGALRLDQIRVSFNMDPITQMPTDVFSYEYKDSNKLIEEFMLLANMAVAHKIKNSFPELAVLRRHPQPLENPLEATVRTLDAVGITLDISSAGALNKSIAKYMGRDMYSEGRLQVITNLCSRPMQFARYFCTGALGAENQFRHYALNVPLYTHYTSPIRRYADLMVHRLLAAAVEPQRYQPPTLDKYQIDRQCEHCNVRKQASKLVQEMSTELYLGLFVRQAKELKAEAMVLMMLDRAFDVLVLRFGVVRRVYLDKLPLENYNHEKSNKKVTITLNWKAEGDKGPRCLVLVHSHRDRHRKRTTCTILEMDCLAQICSIYILRIGEVNPETSRIGNDYPSWPPI
ncbi:hypothetical protein Pcinc_010457 [Petrolisthes cinctipes]|uniref:DIS3-like exonuclease 2 n=1 Tax=Petrolisthes cinctipes TaxID=88211 RepID=A0AAE1G2R7_PETCI|nr:hypothetical protein Pcinc_010457 [Petrolisthes cinctipes]